MGVAHFRHELDLGRDGILEVLERSAELKRLRGRPEHPRPLAGKSIAILLEKASTRTRVSFEVAVLELGGHPLTMVARDLQIGRGEPIEDTARMFSRYVHAVVYRTFGQDRIETMAAHCTIPVINALSDLYHPCQILADLLTVRESLGVLEGVRVAWIGDGNNVAHSWMVAAGLLGMDFVIACPEGYEPSAEVLALAREVAEAGKGRIEVVRDPDAACRGARVITTDVWASMGQEEEATKRRASFAGKYVVTPERMALGAPGAIFLHCLPAHRGEEVEAAVIDGPSSRVWDEAENRLHTQKAILERLVR